jgi:predicted small metal-binding protein
MDDQKLFICNDFQTQVICNYKCEGPNDEVINSAVDHVVTIHNMEDSPQLREDIEKSLKNV